MNYDWKETKNGDWVLLDDGVVAKVYEAAMGEGPPERCARW